MSATATAMLNVARSQIGYLEGPNNDNKYGIWYGWNHVSYCAIGLTWVAAQCNALPLVHGRFAYCPYWVNAFKTAGDWVNYTNSPRPGDLVFYDWSGNRSLADHVGIIEASGGGAVIAIEFNTCRNSGDQSDGQGVWRRQRSTSMVIGYGRPRYALQSSPRPIGPPLPLIIDGVWGPLTTGRLQYWLHLPSTGVIDGATRRALQSRLGVTADGIWGPITHRALQQVLHVATDGIWGPITIKALQRFLNRAGG